MISLTPREQRFVDEYIVDFNGAAAAVRAGYAPKHAKVQASRLLARDPVAEAIQRGRDALTGKVGVSSERVLQELARIAFGNVRGLYREDGSLKAIHELDDDAAAAIAGVDQEDIKAGDAQVGTLRKIKRNDKVKALELLCRVLGMFKDSLTINADFADRLVKARERARQVRGGSA